MERSSWCAARGPLTIVTKLHECVFEYIGIIGIGGDRTRTFRGGGDFAPDFGSKVGPFLGHFGQRQRISGDLGASNTRKTQNRGQKPENLGSRPVPRGQKRHLGYRRVDFWAIYGLKTRI